MQKYLFTTLPSNDLGLLTRSLPIAHELRNRGHQTAFCSPAQAPKKLLSEAGFDNYRPTQLPYYIMSGHISLSQLLKSQNRRRDLGLLFSFLQRRFQFSTAEIWTIDHFMYLFGMWNEVFVQANIDALQEVIQAFEPYIIVYF